MWNRRTYLDFAAGALPNPSSPHAEGRAARARLEDARERIARLVECKSDDLIFTSGATEANALAILGAVRALRTRAGADTPGRNHLHVLYASGAHASITENVRLLADEGIAIEPLPLRDGRVDLDALASLIRAETVLVTMEAICGETGVIWDTRGVRHVLDAARGSEEPRILLHVDASHAPYAAKLTRSHFGADLLVFDGGKVGVRGAGALVAPRTIALAPPYGGGGQERGLRSGTENVEAMVAFARALAKAVAVRDVFALRAERARAALEKSLSRIRGSYVTAGARQAAHILNVSFVGRDTDYLVALLDEAGFALATRSACETDSAEGSRAVLALTARAELARSTLRISWGPEMSGRALARFARTLTAKVAFLDAAALSGVATLSAETL